MESKLSIKYWEKGDRPREKMLKSSATALSNTELMSLIIGTGGSQASAIDISRDLLGSYQNNLGKLSSLSARDLCSNFKGIGHAKACSIIAALELGKRLNLEDIDLSNGIINTDTAFAAIKSEIAFKEDEHFLAVYLNNANRILHKEIISMGGVAVVAVDVKKILRIALREKASCIILAHNHPSGSLTPSKEDIILTRKIKIASELMDIRLLDHFIVCGNRYYSFMENNNLEIEA